MASLKQNTDGSTGIAGAGAGDLASAFIPVSFVWDPNSIDQAFFVAHRKYIVKSVIMRPIVAGTDAGAVTLGIKKSTSGQAPGPGTKVHVGTANLKSTINTNQVMALATDPADRVLPAGSSLCVNFAGVLTAAKGVVTVMLAPA